MIAEILGGVCLGIWCYLILGRGMFWLVREPEPVPVSQVERTRVAVIVPARNESLVVGDAIRSLLRQDYAGPLHVFLVDDESSDDTAGLAQQAAETSGKFQQLTVLRAGPRPDGWTGKLWAVSKGIRHARDFAADYYLLTDADIVHDEHTVGQLVTLAESGHYDLVSLMVELHCQTFAERALIPAFVFFFFMLYPPAWVRHVRRRTAAAAGGCILIGSKILDDIGGIATIRGEWIDDCALARAVKRSGGKMWLGITRESKSIRKYANWQEVGQMISRSAFTQLNHSSLLLGLTCLGMFLTFLLPIVLLFGGGVPGVLGVSSWIFMSLAFLPTLRLYRQAPFLAPFLPMIAVFYLAATIHSAIQYWRGRGGRWKGRVQNTDRQTAT